MVSRLQRTDGSRRRRSTSARAVGSSPYITAEQFEIRNVTASALTVQPGDEITVTTEYGSEFDKIPASPIIDQSHPDYCDEGAFFAPGADLYVRVSAGASRATDGACWRVDNNKSTSESVRVPVPVDPGTHRVDVELVGGTTGQVYDAKSFEVQVDGDAPDDPDRGDDGQDDDKNVTDPGDNCGPLQTLLGNCGDGSGGPFLGTQQTIALAAFTILVIVAFGVTR